MRDTETSVKVVCDSIRWDCDPPRLGPYKDIPGRIVTLQMRYPRWIHSEFMTHRDRARNAASSRAVSVTKGLGNNLFRPMDIPSEQRGMSGGDTLSPQHKNAAYCIIDQMANFATASCTALSQLGVHKSVINRYLEPFAYIDVVCTATRWDHFLGLRDHPDAEPHFQRLAKLIRVALDGSEPVASISHLPYIGKDERGEHPLSECFRVSAARCAAISYLRPDFPWEKELKVCDKLVDNKHSSPLEHPATTSGVSAEYRSGPMTGWKTLRTTLQQD